MRLSAKTLTAIAVIRFLGKNPNQKFSSAQIGQEIRLSSTFVSNILIELKRAGIVYSIKGPGGGYTLKQPYSTITVIEIMMAISEAPEEKIKDSPFIPQEFQKVINQKIVKMLEIKVKELE